MNLPGPWIDDLVPKLLIPTGPPWKPKPEVKNGLGAERGGGCWCFPFAIKKEKPYCTVDTRSSRFQSTHGTKFQPLRSHPWIWCLPNRRSDARSCVMNRRTPVPNLRSAVSEHFLRRHGKAQGCPKKRSDPINNDVPYTPASPKNIQKNGT